MVQPSGSFGNGVAVCCCVCGAQYNIPRGDIARYFGRIDYESKTDTFYPKANITIMPNRRIYRDWEIYMHFGAAMKYQNTLVQAENVIFDMRNYTYRFPGSGRASNNEYAYMILHHMHSKRLGLKKANYFLLVSKLCEVVYSLPDQLRYIGSEYFGFYDEIKHLSRW